MKTFTTPTHQNLLNRQSAFRLKLPLSSLSQFIRWALRITASGECPGDVAIALLDQAWAAQKLLWSLRD
jgi:hypothetical protein